MVQHASVDHRDFAEMSAVDEVLAGAAFMLSNLWLDDMLRRALARGFQPSDRASAGTSARACFRTCSIRASASSACGRGKGSRAATEDSRACALPASFGSRQQTSGQTVGVLHLRQGRGERR